MKNIDLGFQEGWRLSQVVEVQSSGFSATLTYVRICHFHKAAETL